MTKKAIIIGSGFGGLGAACLLAQQGWEVSLHEKNEQLGGRAGLIETDGFRFDTGPSWYLMPEVFERFFGLLGEDVHKHLNLVRLSPAYRVFYKDLGDRLDISSNLAQDMATFERFEPGSGQQLKRYLARAGSVYDVAAGQLLFKNYDRIGDAITWPLLRRLPDLHIGRSLHSYIKQHFKDPRLQKVLEYQAVFLGLSPYQAPAMFHMMSHTDFTQGVFYPMGGIYEIIRALEHLGSARGVTYHLRSPVQKILVENGRAVGVVTQGGEERADIVISNADMHFTEQRLLEPDQRDHSERFWQTRKLAPSALLLYLGVKRQYDSLAHHNLLFSTDWPRTFRQIFDNPTGFPDDPSLYVCAPSKTDPSVAPKGYENLFVLVPIASGIPYSNAQLEQFTDQILTTMEQELDLPDLRQQLACRKVFCVRDFEERFNSFQGTGLGLAQTLRQTAVFRPANHSRKVRDLYFVGAGVHPGIGMPTSLTSAELLARRLNLL